MPKTPPQLLLQKFKNTFTNTLVSLYGENETLQFFYLLCEAYLSFSRVEVSLNHQYNLSEAQLTLFNKALNRLQQHEPIQYVIGTTYFYGNTFKVTPDTLIPRPETEELVDWIINDQNGKQNTILDIGTGSGCIAISLAKKMPEAKVTAVDFSAKALEVAKQNALQNKTTVNFVLLDILKQTKIQSDFDIIISNPPYVRELEKKDMTANVLDHEPDSALFVTNHDPLLFYREIARLIVHTFSESEKQRVLYYEINEYLAQETSEMLYQLGFHSIEVRNDFREKPRMLKALWK